MGGLRHDYFLLYEDQSYQYGYHSANQINTSVYQISNKKTFVVKTEARLPATARYKILRDLTLLYFNVAFGGNAIQGHGWMELFGHSSLSFHLLRILPSN